MITGSCYNTVGRERGGIKAIREAMEKHWAVALGMGRKDILKNSEWCNHQNVEADYMVQGGLGNKNRRVKTILLKNR